MISVAGSATLKSQVLVSVVRGGEGVFLIAPKRATENHITFDEFFVTINTVGGFVE